MFQPRSKGIEEVEFRIPISSLESPKLCFCKNNKRRIIILRYLAQSALENSDPSESLIEIGKHDRRRRTTAGNGTSRESRGGEDPERISSKRSHW